MNPNKYANPQEKGNYNEANDGMQVDGNQNQNTPAPNSRTPTNLDGYTMIPPNESRRSEMQRISQIEEEHWQKYKEEHKPGPINLAPEILGGSSQLSEARERQQMEANRSKLQKRLKKEDMDKEKRKVEEQECQKMKAVQRAKADRLHMKKEEEERRQTPSQEEIRKKREVYLQKQQRLTSVPTPASSSAPASSGGEHLEGERLEMDNRNRQMETKHLRLEASGSGTVSDLHPCLLESGGVWQSEEPQDPASSHVTFPSQPHADSRKEVEGADVEWIVMKLMNHFPYYERQVIKDVVSQCNDDYQKAFDLLNY